MSDKDLLEFTEFVHTMFCELPHAREMEQLNNRQPNVCYWKLEETLDSKWECDSHKRALTTALGFIELLELGDATKAITFFEQVLEHCTALNELISEHPNSSSIVKGFLG